MIGAKNAAGANTLTSGEDSGFGWPNIGEMYFDPNVYAPGSLGKVVSYASAPGPFKDTVIYTELDHFLQTEYDAFRGLYSTYNARKTVYDAAKTAYDNAITVNNDRANAVPDGWQFLSFLLAPTIVPSRPCKPDQPDEAWG